MAEIEFKRRGTPLWAVLLVLLVVAGILYGVFARRGPQPAAGPADTVTTPTGPAPTAAAPTPAPATPAVAPVDAYVAWADSAKVPTAAPDAAHYVATGLRLLVPVLKERAPMAGVQQLLIGAMADTLDMPTLPESKHAEAAQSAFFAVNYALRGAAAKPQGDGASSGLENAAAAVRPQAPLRTQRDAVHHFFEVAGQTFKPRGRAPAAAAPAKP